MLLAPLRAAAVARARGSSIALVACVLLLVVGAAGCAKKTGPPTPPQVTRPAPPPDPSQDRPAPDPEGPRLLLRGATVMTATGVVYSKGDVLLEGNRIAAVGASVSAPEDTTVIDLTGKVITPGIIDTHSHIGVYAAPGFAAHADGNEATAPTTPGMRAGDAVWPQDPQLERARAGGITTMQILPGSANLIGGRSVVIKPRLGPRSLEDARFTVA
ncbi:MAG: hypothetical protein K0V04_45000, partial [Deltaproteobacteria bacterium]|nr:hypothetical protein [Deltaproteobacteria bacterium]